MFPPSLNFHIHKTGSSQVLAVFQGYSQGMKKGEKKLPALPSPKAKIGEEGNTCKRLHIQSVFPLAAREG